MSHNPSDIDFLRQRYAAARNRYRPSLLRTLLIAEAPPSDIDRYFYFEDVPRQDSLFLEVMGVLYPDDKASYLASKRDPELKAALLEMFASDGFWLMHISELPQELLDEAHADALPGLLEHIKAQGWSMKALPAS